MANLLPEIITEILYRLPVKSLLRFRCVSKPWCYQIDDPFFIKLHINHSLKTNTNLSLILADNSDEFFSIDLDTLDTAIKLNNPAEDGAGTLGSCSGLVALFHSHQDIALWNPSTRKYHILPTIPIESPRGFSKSIAYGFGYDPVSDDYKIVRIVLYYCRDQDLKKSQVKVYSLKSNSWRWARDFPYYHCYHLLGNGVLVNNTLHWMVSTKSERDSPNMIVAFDLRVEEYFEVLQPDYMDNNSSFMCVESLGGCLSIVCDYVEVRVDVWVMKEYGVKKSWTKLFSVAQEEVTGGFVFLRPMAYLKASDKVLLDQDNEKFVWYDLRRKRIEKVRIQGAPKSFEVEMCVGSLTPLNGGQQAGGI